MGYYVPPKILRNSDLEKMVDTSNEWITTRTGIKQRRIAEPDVSTSLLGYRAAKKALRDAGITAREIDLIIVATTTQDMFFPSTACIIQQKLRAKGAAAFDIAAACCGFIFALNTAYHYVLAGTYQRVLVVAAEVLSKVVDWTDRNTCVLFGDGAGACVVGKVRTGGILSSYMASDGTWKDLLEIPAGGSRMPASHLTVDERLHYIKMRGNEVFKLAVKMMAEAGNKAVALAGIECRDIDCVIPHQANYRIINATASRLGIDLKKVYMNVNKYGNMSSASTVVALTEAVKKGRIRKGDRVLLVAFGSGLVWSSMVLEWSR
ncbi:MAG: ketoacyl-ACP synthase III [Candidatus Omnitrophica bacterium]|nr:ketoacyl-ACP synthase III [Candidatus Omnitrophota bacterium]